MRSNSHRSSFSRSHRSGGLSRSHSRSSMHHSSLTHNSMHRSTMHRTSLGSKIHKVSKMSGVSSMHSNAFRHHGISNAHAFAVGKATGVNINGSPMGAHGAALYRSRKMRAESHFKGSRRHGVSSVFNKRTSVNNTCKSSDFLKRMRVSHNKHRYTSKKVDYSKEQNMGNEANIVMNEFLKYVWIPLIIAIMIFLGIIFFGFIFFLFLVRGIMIF